MRALLLILKKRLLLSPTFLWLLVALSTQGCALVSELKGGPKDETPPKLIATTPAPKSTHVSSRTLYLTFDKEIEVEDIQDKLVITPRLKQLPNTLAYTHTAYGRTLKLRLNAPLEKNTTYTFNFNDAVKDTTEGNKANAPTLSFSTGATIDAMQISGKVCCHLTQEPACGIWVGIYKAAGKPPKYLEQLPDYFTKTDKEGKYHLKNISKGKYYIYASSNVNSTLKINPEVDEYGFMTKPVDVTSSSIKNVDLSIIASDVRNPQLQHQQKRGNYFDITFNKRMTTYNLSLLSGETLQSHWIKGQRAVRIHNTLGMLEEDKLEAQITAKDQFGQTMKENVMIQFEEDWEKSALTYNISPTSGAAINTHFVGTITCTKPIQDIKPELIFFTLNGKKVVELTQKDLQHDPLKNTITLSKELPPHLSQKTTDKEKLGLRLAEGALVSIDKEINQDTQLEYKLQPSKAYGTVQGTITTQTPNFVVQLLDEKHQVVASLHNQHHYQFQNISPGQYKIRVLTLRSPNAPFYTGNILKGTPPDPVHFYKAGATVTVLANWTIDNAHIKF